MSPEAPDARSATGTIKVSLTGSEDTALTMLYARALDSSQTNPILGDKWAAEIVSKLDYDFPRKTGVGCMVSAEIAARSGNLDRMTEGFLVLHAGEPVTVVHLACGLDTRCLRVKHGPEVRWVDVDLPGIVDLRERVFPSWNVDGDYTLLAGSAADVAGWIDRIPADRPTLVVFEGLTMYLNKAQGRHLFEGIVSRFGGKRGVKKQNQIVCDALGSIIVRLQGWVYSVKDCGAVLDWAIDDTEMLCREWCDGRLELVEHMLAVGMPGVERYPWAFRAAMAIGAWFPYVRSHSKLLRYRF
ncbi:S-adenosyl-L-methionine-dependent methyltransferase [Rhypophila sp. PSN 637]